MENYPAVRLHDLRVRRGRREVLRGLTLEVPRGSLVGLLGPSGAGKTSLMRSVLGIQAGVSGEASVLGRPAGSPELRGRIGYLAQTPSVYDDLTVRQNLAYFRVMAGADREHVGEALERTGLDDLADRLVGTLSGGQRGRVSLAVALLGRPELLVLDEPTVGLDPVLRAELWTLFHRVRDEGTTLLVSSHVMDEAVRCDRLVLLRDGEVLADTTPDELLARTRTRTAEDAFLAIVAGRTWESA